MKKILISFLLCFSITTHLYAQPRIVAFVSDDPNDVLDRLISPALEEVGQPFGDIQLEVVKWKDVGEVRTLSQEYLKDPNVLALITTGTGSTLNAANAQGARNTLILSIDATSTILKSFPNVSMIAPTNHKQAKTIKAFLDDKVKKQQRMSRYVIVMEEDPTYGIYAFDAYLNLLKIAFDSETVIPLNSETAPFSQLLGTFSLIAGDDETARTVAASIRILKPDVIVYSGSKTFSFLYALLPDQNWLLDSLAEPINREGFYKRAQALMYGLPSDKNKSAYYYSTIDTIEVLKHILSLVEGTPTREKVLATSYQLNNQPYQGITGIKSFVETDQTGWYDIITPDPMTLSNNTASSITCNTTQQGLFNGACNAGGQPITYDEIHKNSSISNAILDTSLTNHGLVSNLQIVDDGSLEGGRVSGYIKNLGKMTNFDFVGASIDGLNEEGEAVGILSGKINNASKIQGFIQNVNLSADTVLQGGLVRGQILGDKDSPAILKTLTVAANSHLSHVVLEEDVMLEKNVTLTNVTVKIPQISDITLAGQVTGQKDKPTSLQSVNILSNTQLSHVILDQDVKLEENVTLTHVTLKTSQVNKATLAGKITGQTATPVLLESVTILSNAELSNVILGQNVELEKNITFGENVQLQLAPKSMMSGIEKSGNMIDVQSVFNSTISIKDETLPAIPLTLNSEEMLEVSTTISIDPSHYEQPAELLIVYIHETGYKMQVKDEWIDWDTQLDSLQTAKVVDKLQENVAVPITLKPSIGDSQLYVGYRLKNDTIVYNQSSPIPIHVESETD